MEKKEMYVAPEVEILEVSVEKGFEGSNDDPAVNPPGVADEEDWL